MFVDIESGDLVDYPEQLEFRPKAGDMIVWDARSIHKIDGPESKDWGVMKRRVLGGTGVKKGAVYMGEDRALFSDMSTHTLRGEFMRGCLRPALSCPISRRSTGTRTPTLSSRKNRK